MRAKMMGIEPIRVPQQGDLSPTRTRPVNISVGGVASRDPIGWIGSCISFLSFSI